MDENATYRVHIKGGEHPECKNGKTVLQSLVDRGVFVEANCSGRGSCGKCKIQVLDGAVVDKEGQLAESGDDGAYLACQIYPRGDITIAVKKRGTSQKAQDIEIFAGDGPPLARKIVIAPVYPTVNQHYSLQEMIQQALTVQEPDIGQVSNYSFLEDSAVLRRLGKVTETKPEQITLTLLQEKAIAVEAGDTSAALYGAAFDIGTTTVAGMLVDLKRREVVAVCSRNNPQASMGADVISRIQATHELEGGLERLSQLIRICLNQMIEELCGLAGIESCCIYAVNIAGNATMSHLVLGISPSSLVRKPYATLFKYISWLSPQEMELDINPQGKINVLPNIESFVGSDTTAAILAVNQDVSGPPMLLIDLGTNGEMVIRDEDRLYACSTAAGPAFEGAHIRDGMRAADGAICDVTIDQQDVLIQVIGDGKPSGICGSGIIKAVAQLLKAGVIEANGRFKKSAAASLPALLRQRLKNQDGQWEFVLVKAEDSASGADISITQADIRQIQLVKSSICTGIQFLMDKLPGNQKMKVCLAGAFGNYVDIESAAAIGMLPGIETEWVSSVGNAAGTGAVQSLLSAEHMQRCIDIAAKVQYVELAAQPGFQTRFLANLNFPQTRTGEKSAAAFG